jgi:hypothetical protein
MAWSGRMGDLLTTKNTKYVNEETFNHEFHEWHEWKRGLEQKFRKLRAVIHFLEIRVIREI